MSKLLDVIEADLKYVETLAETKLLPWVEHVLKQIEHDVVTQILPVLETSGAQVAAELLSGRPVGEIGAQIAAVAVQFAKNLEKVGAQVTVQDFSAALTGYFASLAATGAKSTDAQPGAGP